MVSQPEITATEVIQAAEVLEKMSELYSLDRVYGEWSAGDLRSELIYIDQLEAQQKLRAVVAKNVEDAVIAGLDLVDAVKAALVDYEIQGVE